MPFLLLCYVRAIKGIIINYEEILMNVRLDIKFFIRLESFFISKRFKITNSLRK